MQPRRGDGKEESGLFPVLRPNALWGFLAAVAFGPGQTNAATFDQQLTEPALVSATALPAIAEAVLGTDESSASTDLARSLKDENTWRNRVRFIWQVGTRIDRGLPIAELERFGLQPIKDGAYRIDLKQHPTWWPLEERMRSFLGPADIERTADELRPLGFREQDIAALRAHLDRNDCAAQELARTRDLVASFTQKQSIGRRQMTRAARDTRIRSFMYQRKLAVASASAQWAAGVMDVLDAQRQRILVSYLMSLDGEMTIGPDNERQLIETTERGLESGLYRADLERKIQETLQ